jgi:hypothetical protein
LAAFFGIFRHRKPAEDFMDTQPGKQVQVESGLPRLARIWAVLLSAAFILAWAAAVYYATVDITYSLPPYMLVVLVAILAASMLVVGPMIFTTLAWRRRYWSLAGRIHYTLVTAALLGMVWLLYTWRLLGFRM